MTPGSILPRVLLIHISSWLKLKNSCNFLTRVFWSPELPAFGNSRNFVKEPCCCVCAPTTGGSAQPNGQATAEVQEELALTNMGGGASGNNKRHSSQNPEKLLYPRSNLTTITTLGMGGGIHTVIHTHTRTRAYTLALTCSNAHIYTLVHGGHIVWPMEHNKETYKHTSKP